MVRRILFLLLRAAFLALFILRGTTARCDDIPFELPPQEELAKLRSAIIYTDAGDIHFRLFPRTAPWHIANFKYLADKGFYRGLTFHLFKPGYIIQGGDPLANGLGGPPYSLPPEFSERKHVFGVLGMARRPDQLVKGGPMVNPERRSSSCQFHILLGRASPMDQRYTIFGEITSGQDVLRALEQGSKIEDIKVFVHPEEDSESPRERRRRRDTDQRSGDSR